MATEYTRESLAEAVRASATLSEAITRLGRVPTNGRRRYVRGLLERWGIDATHLEREGVRHTERQLRELVSESSSIAEVVRRLGIAPVGGNQAHISRRIAALGIDTSHFTAVRPRRPRGSLGDRLVLGSPADGRVPGERLRRLLVRQQGVSEECAECGIGPGWNGKPLRLEVDHLNGDWWDNRPGNLRLLCPNCHAVTDTFRGRKRRAAAR
ncbi:HNH endonuclease [Streptomyces sp. S1A]|uniref:HNH endonuclease signature motif containing protein n=1 Tax=Streptomyces sp. ICN903 TaxID=2964654 RepID=UPI001EDBC239|nr:HNH endonuclease [Streptomyces sp. ICN903]MCG3044054.1 HNH endonuclease [Streptomyces sp. ICN903]